MLNHAARRTQVVIPVILMILASLLTGCSERDLDALEPATAPVDPIVYRDAFEGGLDYSAFEYSYYEAFSIDQSEAYDGTASLKVTLPENDTWAGGSFWTRGPRDLSDFNALVFWAKASQPYTIDAVGFGLGIGYPSDYLSSITNVTFSTSWERYIIPIPNAVRMTAEHGMFWYSATADGSPVNIWFDEVEYARVNDVTNPRPFMSTRPVQALVGEQFEIPGTYTTFDVDGTERVVFHTYNHFDFFSSDEAVVSASGNIVTAVSLGEATITAKLGDVDVQGVVTAQVVNEITRPAVFIDSFDAGLDYASFGDGQYLAALSIDPVGGVNGSAAMKINIPSGQYAGGAMFSTDGGRDLSTFNALVFDARADQANYVVANIGFGIGMSAGGTDYQTDIRDVVLGTDWQRYVVLIPEASRLTAEAGVFWYSAGQAGNFWLDNIQFMALGEGEITDIQPVMDSLDTVGNVGQIIAITGTQASYRVGDDDVTVFYGPLYYDYASSDESVALAADGQVTVVGGGTSTITATLGTTPVTGSVTVTVIAPPENPAPTPVHAASGVISLFSNAYDDVTVDTWRASWSSGVSLEDIQIAGDDVKAYAGFANPARYAGIEFTTDLIDAAGAGMTHFHMDVYFPTGSQFGFKLVDFGPDGVYGGPGSDDTEHQVDINASSTPPFATDQWISLDIPLADFAGMNLGHLAQIVLNNSNTGSLWIDNVYFHDGTR